MAGVRERRVLIGTPVLDLETPVLVVDLAALEHNIGVIARHYSGGGADADQAIRLRPHGKNHKAPGILAMQVAAGGTVGGVCAAKVSEAEVFVEAGAGNVLIANQVVDPAKIRRLVALAGRVETTVAVDSVAQVALLARGPASSGAGLGVVIEVDTMMGRAGVRSVAQAVALARRVAATPGLEFRGVMSHQVLRGPGDRANRFAEGGRYIERVLEVRRAIEDAGIAVDIVSTGESWTYDVAATYPEVTEIEGGTYVFMEVPYAYMREFRFALRVMGRVVARPDARTAIGDVPIDAIGAPNGLPTLEGPDAVTVTAIDHHGVVLSGDDDLSLQVGDPFFLLTHQQDVTVNRWDRYVGVRDGRVERIIEAPARGCVH